LFTIEDKKDFWNDHSTIKDASHVQSPA
jgi:hypothetical protein